MAKISKVVKNEKRKRRVALWAERRAEAKRVINDPNSTPEQVDAAVVMLQKMPRDASPVRVRNRCALTGRPRGYLRKFGMSRVALRDLALQGQIPGSYEIKLVVNRAEPARGRKRQAAAAL